MQQLTGNKWMIWLSLFVLFASTALFAYVGDYKVLILPVGYLFVSLMLTNWKIGYWILLFTIPFATQIYFLGGALSTTIPDEPIMWLFLLTFVLMFFRNPEVLPQWWWRNPLVMVIVLQYIWTIVTVCFSTEPLYSVKFLAAKTWFLVAFFVFPVFVFRSKKDFKIAFFALIIPMIVTMVIILIRHRAIGFNFRKVESAIGWFYYNHVDYSTVISMFFPLLITAYALLRGRTGWRLITIGTIVFFLVAIWFTYARAATLAVVFALIVGLAMRLRLAKLVMPGFYILMVLVLAYVINDRKYIDFRPNYNKTYMRKTFADHIKATIQGQDMSSMERLYRWVAGVRMSNEKPITGWGPNSFYYHYKPYAVNMFRTYVSRNPEKSTTHNYFLYMLVEQGWPAMILYAILVALVIAKAQNIYVRLRHRDRFYANCAIGLAMVFAAGFINNFFSELLETHKVGALFYISIALLVVLDRKSRELEEQGQNDGDTTVITHNTGN